MSEEDEVLDRGHPPYGDDFAEPPDNAVQDEDGFYHHPGQMPWKGQL